jgi:hypothetical protein
MPEPSHLVQFRVDAAPVSEPPYRWHIYIQTEESEYRGWADSRLVTILLEAALLNGRKRQRWPVIVEIDEETSRINRVRIYDDRDCKGVLESLEGKLVLPLTPTAFADENPPRWGFFFQEGDDCKEAKGTNLNLYEIIEKAWRDEESVLLRLDDQGYIIGVGDAREP